MAQLLSNQEINDFVENGFVRIDNAFTAETASAAREILWNDLLVKETESSIWQEPVIRLGMYTQKPFIDSVNSEALYGIFNQLIGAGRWLPCNSVGSFPIRFPSTKKPTDTGIHVDASFPGNNPADYMSWRVNVQSKGRALLMLVLYSDVTVNDAPTLIYKKSHKDVAQLLAPQGERGLSFMELATALSTLPLRNIEYATGKAGTIYLCHPFIAHAAQEHKGVYPKFMGQPPLLHKTALNITNASTGFYPVEEAIRSALSNDKK